MSVMVEGHPPVVVLLLARNDRQKTLRCLASVERLEGPRPEIVLIDNGSTDGTWDAVGQAFPRVHRVRRETNLGVAAGRNLGIEHARSRFPSSHIWILDNDAWAEPSALREMLAVLDADPSAGLIAPKIFLPTSPPVFAAAGGHRINWYTGRIRSVGAGERDRGQYDRYRPITCNGGSVLVRRDVFTRIGTFDELFNPYGWEDLDFALRARKAGFAIRLAPAAIVYHEGGKAGRGRALPEYERSKMRGYVTLIRRHASPLQWACFVCLLPLKAIVRSATELRRGRAEIVLAHLRGAAEALTRMAGRRGDHRGRREGR